MVNVGKPSRRFKSNFRSPSKLRAELTMKHVHAAIMAQFRSKKQHTDGIKEQRIGADVKVTEVPGYGFC